MRYALVGYGRMGRAIESAAAGRGHELVGVVDPGVGDRPGVPRLDARALRGAEVAFEFTAPGAAEENVLALLALRVAVVCGTTGWDPSSRRVARALERFRGALLVAPNFSLGMSVFVRVVSDCARALGRLGGYDPFVVECHHRGKADAPSGTARRLAEAVREGSPRPLAVCEGNPRGRVAPGAIHLASVRAGHEPGVHTVGFDGEHDVITLTHRSRGRSALALGAVLAGEWLRGRSGRRTFEEVVGELVRPSRRPARVAGRSRGGRRR